MNQEVNYEDTSSIHGHSESCTEPGFHALKPVFAEVHFSALQPDCSCKAGRVLHERDIDTVRQKKNLCLR